MPAKLEDKKDEPQEELVELYETNILVATWIDDIGHPQKDQEDKILFYNNESLLNRGGETTILNHFSHLNKKHFADKNIEFCSKKGIHEHIN